MTPKRNSGPPPKALLWLALSVAMLVLWAALAGGLLLAALGGHFDDATPLTLYHYWRGYDSQPNVHRWLRVAASVALILMLIPVALWQLPARRSLFGNARFARRTEIREAGLLGERGIIVGKLGNRYLMFDGQQHAIISAPTRSGKGVGIVIPNLLNWPDSVVVLDIKQENWDITSGFRARHGQQCFLFNPAATDYRSHRYNPLAYISTDPHFRIDDVQKIANMLFPDQPGTDMIWTATPRSLFLGIVLFLLETPGKPVTLGQVLRETLAHGDGADYFAQLINVRQQGPSALSDACVRALTSYISISSDNTRAGVMTSFRSRLELWMNPLVDAATSANDFDLRDVRRQRMSIYLGVTPDNLERLAPLLNLFFQQLIDLNTRALPNQDPTLKIPCLLLMDEFTAIGKMPSLAKGIGYIAGYGLRMMPIIQSPAQLIEVYGKEAAQTFTTNHALNIIFAPKASETQTARDISDWLGYQTVKGVSASRGAGLLSKKARTENISDQRRALLLPQEITGLGPRKALIIVDHLLPILARKVVYYEERVFLERLQSIAPRLRVGPRYCLDKALFDDVIAHGELAAVVPEIDLDAHLQEVNDTRTINVDKLQGRAEGGTTRSVTPDDLAQLAAGDLPEFAIDFAAVATPPAGDLDEAALHAYADSLCRQAGIMI